MAADDRHRGIGIAQEVEEVEQELGPHERQIARERHHARMAGGYQAGYESLERSGEGISIGKDSGRWTVIGQMIPPDDDHVVGDFPRGPYGSGEN